MNLIKRIKTIMVVTFYFALFIPIYNGVFTTFSGPVPYMFNVNGMGNPTLVKSVIIVVALIALIGIHLRPSIEKITSIIAMVIVALLLGLIFAVKDTATLGLGFYIELVALVIFILAVFLPQAVLKAYEVSALYLGKAGGFLYKIAGEKPQEEGEAPAEEEEPEEEAQAEPEEKVQAEPEEEVKEDVEESTEEEPEEEKHPE